MDLSGELPRREYSLRGAYLGKYYSENVFFSIDNTAGAFKDEEMEILTAVQHAGQYASFANKHNRLFRGRIYIPENRIEGYARRGCSNPKI